MKTSETGKPKRRESSNEKESDMQSYKGKQATVTYDENVCVHAGKCVGRLPSVFNLDRDPWIDPDAAELDALEETIKACPSGALGLTRNSQ